MQRTERLQSQSSATAPLARAFWVYLLRCRNGSLYCGQTANLPRRLAEHACGRGARAVRLAGYGELAASWQVATRRDALRLEARLKRLSKPVKEALVARPASLAALSLDWGVELSDYP